MRRLIEAAEDASTKIAEALEILEHSIEKYTNTSPGWEIRACVIPYLERSVRVLYSVRRSIMDLMGKQIEEKAK